MVIDTAHGTLSEKPSEEFHLWILIRFMAMARLTPAYSCSSTREIPVGVTCAPHVRLLKAASFSKSRFLMHRCVTIVVAQLVRL